MSTYGEWTQFRRRKSAQIGKLLRLIEAEGPVSTTSLITQAMNKLKIPRASLLRYLVDLREMQLVGKDTDGRWAGTRTLDANVRKYPTERELKEARIHTSKIVQTVEGIRWVDDPNIVHTGEPEFGALTRALAENDCKAPDGPASRKACLPDFVQHLRTGYFREFWIYLEEYSAIQKKYGFPRIHAPKTPGLRISRRYFVEDAEVYRNIAGGNAFHDVSKADIIRARELINMLVGQLDRIAHETAEGIPLKGTCDFCPGAKVLVENLRIPEPGERGGHG
jgi:hypothetical protein